jgi:hypothetical protein
MDATSADIAATSRADDDDASRRARIVHAATSLVLFRLRCAWTLLIATELLLSGVASLTAEHAWIADVSGRKAGATVFILGAASMTVVLFAGLLARRWFFAPNHDGAVGLRSYVHGTVTLHLCCAAGVAMTLVMIVLTGRTMPLLLVVGLAVATQLVSFPAGSVLKRRGHRGG